MNDKGTYIFVFAMYVIFSLMICSIRAIAPPGQKGDCEVRYVDLVFPLSRLHCPLNFTKDNK